MSQVESVTLYLGDCLDILREMPDNSIDALVTDPPAGIGFMGKEWDNFGSRRNGDAQAQRDKYRAIDSNRPGYAFMGGSSVNKKTRDTFVAFMVEVMSECLRVLKPGAHALVWALPRTSHWTGWALEEAGFEVRDRIAHLFGSGFPKSLDVSKAIDKMAGAEREVTGRYQPPNGTTWNLAQADDSTVEHAPGTFTASGTRTLDITAPATPAAVQWQGWGTALKPACEDWWLCRKPLAEGTVAANVLEWGTGAINIDATRIPTNGEDRAARYNGKPPLGGMSHGIYQDNPRTKPWEAHEGRFPANVTHDGSEEVLAGFPQSSITGNRRNGHRVQQEAAATPFTRGIDAPEYTDSGSAARFFYCAKASRQDREEGCEGLEEQEAYKMSGGICIAEGRTAAKGKARSTNHHPTVKPTPLMRWLCRLVTPPGGTVLDPFMGSGSTGKACALEGFGFVGIELDPEYYEIAKRRIEHVQHQPQMVMEL